MLYQNQMIAMEINKKNEIIKCLGTKIGMIKCPMCNKGTFTLLDGYAINSLQEDQNTIIIGGNTKRFACVVIVCNNCGYTSYHNIHALQPRTSDE